MPKYFAGTAKSLYVGETFIAFNAEPYTTGTVPQLSAAIVIGARQAQSAPQFSVEVTFSGAPGTFEVDVCEASTDAANNYILNPATAAKITTVSANQIARGDVQLNGPFIAINLVALANSVNVTVKITRVS